MKRSEIIDAAEELKNALAETGLVRLIGRTNRDKTEEAKNVTLGEILKALKRYSIRAHSFTPSAQRLVQILELDVLEDPARWLRLVDYNPFSSQVRGHVTFAVNYLPKIVRMIEPEALKEIEEKSRVEDSHYKDMRILTVNVFEPKNLFSSPLRLATVFESINHFYTACALMEDSSPSTISVVACDSGSDKSFDFLGLAKVMESVERLIGTIWDRAFFFRERQFEERLDLVAKSLPIIERLKTMEDQKQIEPEMAEILRRHIFDGSNKFLQSGATITRIEDTSEYNPRVLLSPVQKLLVAAPDERDEEAQYSPSIADEEKNRETKSASSKVDISCLTAEEQKQLISLLEKSRIPSNTEPDTDNDLEDPLNESSYDTDEGTSF